MATPYSVGVIYGLPLDLRTISNVQQDMIAEYLVSESKIEDVEDFGRLTDHEVYDLLTKSDPLVEAGWAGSASYDYSSMVIGYFEKHFGSGFSPVPLEALESYVSSVPRTGDHLQALLGLRDRLGIDSLPQWYVIYNWEQSKVEDISDIA